MTLRISRRLLSLALFAGLGTATVFPGAVPTEAAPTSDRLDRQIRVMEDILNETLIDSPNWLVYDRDNARGTYLEGYGALFTIEVSLVDDGWWSTDHGRHSIWVGSHRIVVWGDDEDDDRGSGKDRDKDRDERIQRESDRAGRRYDHGKTELVDALLDYGDALSSLSGDDWVEVDAQLVRADYFRDKSLHRLTVKLKAGDIRAYAGHQLSEEQVRARARIEEN